MPRPIDVPEHMEEHPDRTAIAPAAYDWPEQLEHDLRAMVAEQPPSAWRCCLHGVVTTSDCPRCDDELIALTEETHEGGDAA